MAAKEFKMLGCLRVRRVENKGLGLFVTQDIPANTIISCEEPSMYAPLEKKSPYDEVKIESFCNLYRESSQAQRTRLDDHACNMELYEANKNFYSIFDKWYVNHLKAQGTFDSSVSRTDKVLKLIRSYSTFWTNCASVYDKEVGFWSTFARANHSCIPNSNWKYVGRSPFLLQLVTIKDIPAGSEVTVTYLGLEKDNLQRRREVLRGWGFTCTCERCTEEELGDQNTRKPRSKLF
ncbi:SET domain-containing protein [Daldinia caldariorum]|uniref:SET domain-containing protein n=1 Tax=Daldinia caldariorum TaxID=326644 RepID=UPI002007F80A|nr:SET domain-containing protein [Daldinia caldariorum]KAI1466448.1 SET domain-containing protein [Daldinia caldariorum]